MCACACVCVHVCMEDWHVCTNTSMLAIVHVLGTHMEIQRAPVPGLSRNAPVYACKVAVDGNCNGLNPFKALYAANLRIKTAKAT